MTLPIHKLGKLAPRHDKRTLRLERFFTADLAPAPAELLPPSITFPIDGNDRIGDCGFVGQAHAEQFVSTMQLDPVILSEVDVIAGYSEVTGYNPTTGDNDNGVVLLDALNWWRTNGIAGHKCDAFASVHPTNIEHIKQAILLGGFVYAGIELPIAWQGETKWDVPHLNFFLRFLHARNTDNDPGSWGGHCVVFIGYDAEGVFVSTWDQVLKLTWAALQVYCSETYFVILPEWFKDNKDARGIDRAAILASVAAITA